MKDTDLEYENSSELSEILFNMNSEEFLETELSEQLNEEIFSSNKTNYLEAYLTKYKFCKNEYCANDGFIESLKNNKDELIEFVITQISDRFNLTIDEDSRGTKMAKILYDFFVINYNENLKNLFLCYILNNKKNIISILKKEKKRRDISVIASKVRYSNNNDALLVDNVAFIINEIILSSDIENFVDMISQMDNTVTNLKMTEYINKEKVSIDEETLEAFINPYIEEETGWSDIISDIVMELSNKAVKSDVDIYK